MPTGPRPLLLSDIVDRAVEVCDPTGESAACQQFLLRFEDADEPVTAMAALKSQISEAASWIDPEREDPAFAMAEAVCTYLAFRRKQLNDSPQQILRLAARAGFEGRPPPHVTEWLDARGVVLRGPRR